MQNKPKNSDTSKKKKALVFSVSFLFFLLFLIEFVLRLLNFQPGFFQLYNNFHPVGSLEVYKNFENDDYGIYCFTDWVSDSIPKHYDFEKQKANDYLLDNFFPLDDIFNIYQSFFFLEKGKVEQSFFNKIKNKDEIFDDSTPLFKHYHQNIKNKLDNLSGLDNLIAEYVERPYNSYGFRSIPFKIVEDRKKPSVLLIGDSFVYGMSSKPYYTSFSDILLAKGFVVYNTGIPGVDPAQYLAVAQKYIPLLQPDIVIVNFFPGNDFMSFERPTIPSQPHEHITNAGFFESSPMGKYLSPKEAYDFYLSLSFIPPNNFFNRMMSSTAITSMLWNVFRKFSWVNHQKLTDYEEFLNTKNQENSIKITQGYLKGIEEICNDNNSKLINVVIPYRYNQDIEKNTFFKVDSLKLNELYNGSSYHYPTNLKDEDFYKDNYHFNKLGAKKYADFLEMRIVEQIKF